MSSFQFEIGARSRGSATVGQKLFISLIMLGFIAGGGFLTYEATKDFASVIASRSWQPTSCTILRSRIPEKSPYQFAVSYSYNFNGTPFTGQLLYEGYAGSEDFYDAQKIRERYPKGSTSTCLVNPADPHQSALQQRSLWRGLVILFPLLFVAVGVGVLYLIWRKAPPPRSNVPLRHPKFVLGLFFGVFFIAGAAVLGFFIPSLLRGLAAKNWPQAPAVVVQTGVASHTTHSKNGSHTSYNVTVLFHYTYQGQRHASSRYQLVKSSSSSYADQQNIADALLRQKNTVCYVNPADPDDAVLERSFGAAVAASGLMSILFMGIGGFGVLWVLRQSRNEHRAKILAHLSPVQSGPAELKPALSANLKFAAILAPALFWNGIVSVFLCAIIPELQRGRIDLVFPLIFVSVFALIGLALLVAALRKSAMLFYPCGRLGIDHHPLRLGQPAQLHWEIAGRHDRITHLKLRVTGFRSTQVPIGLPAFRRLIPFWSKDLLDTTRPAEIRTGHCPLLIPPDALPTPVETGTIWWAILLDADISKPADLQEEFPIQVVSNNADGSS
jgi:hypothetical protein